MYNDFFTLIINTIVDLFELLNFPIVTFNGVSITYLHLIIACFIIPIILSFVKLSIGEGNSMSDVGFLTNRSRTNREMAYRNSPLFYNQNGQYRNPKHSPTSVDTDGWL